MYPSKIIAYDMCKFFDDILGLSALELRSFYSRL